MPHSHKYDSYRDSALHFLCNAGWGNESTGNTDGYGVYLTRIGNTWEDVKPSNTEFLSVIEDWPDYEDATALYPQFFTQLIGHFIVSEDSQGFVHVRHYVDEAEVKRRYDQFAEHYNEWAEMVGE